MTKCQLIITLLFTIYFNSLQNILLSSFECHPNFYAILYANEVSKWRHFISQLAELRPIYNSWRQYQTINTESEYLSILSNMSSQVIVLCSIQYCSVLRLLRESLISIQTWETFQILPSDRIFRIPDGRHHQPPRVARQHVRAQGVSDLLQPTIQHWQLLPDQVSQQYLYLSTDSEKVWLLKHQTETAFVSSQWFIFQ